MVKIIEEGDRTSYIILNLPMLLVWEIICAIEWIALV